LKEATGGAEREAIAKEYPFIQVVTMTGKLEELVPRIIAERRRLC